MTNNKQQQQQQAKPRNAAKNANKNRRRNAQRKAARAAKQVQSGGSNASSSTTMAPVSISSQRGGSVPRFKYSSKGSVIITHRELMADISTVNGVTKFLHFPLNPGMANTFHWLRCTALNYEFYRFHALAFEYDTTRSTSTDGAIIMSIDYDAKDNYPTSKQEQTSNQDWARTATWNGVKLNAAKANLSRRGSLYVRGGPVPSGTDLKTYDLGVLTVGAYGVNTTNSIGELYVTYTVEFSVPSFNDTGAGTALYSVVTGSGNSTPQTTITGNLDLSAASTGTTTSVTTYTFNTAYEGIVSVLAGGTGITAPPASGGSCTHTDQSLIADATGSYSTQLVLVDADPGQTLVLTVPNTTIVGMSAWFTQGNFFN